MIISDSAKMSFDYKHKWNCILRNDAEYKYLNPLYQANSLHQQVQKNLPQQVFFISASS